MVYKFSSIAVNVVCAHCEASSVLPLHFVSEADSFQCANCGKTSRLNTSDREALMAIATSEYTPRRHVQRTVPSGPDPARRKRLQLAFRNGELLG